MPVISEEAGYSLPQGNAAIGPFAFWLDLRHRAGELSWIVAGKFALMGANVLLMLLLAQRLRLADLGRFIAVIGAQIFLSRLLMLGVDGGMIRLRTLEDLRDRSMAVVAAGLTVIRRAIVTFVLSSVLAVPVLVWGGHTQWIGAIVPIVIGAIGTVLVDYSYSYRLARLEYRAAALIQGSTAIVRLAMTAFTSLLFPHHLLAVLLTYAGVSLLSGWLNTTARTLNNKICCERHLVRRLLRYSLWQGLSNVAAVFTLYQGIFLLWLIHQPDAAGILGMALMLSMVFFYIRNGFYEYLLSRTVQLKKLSMLPGCLVRNSSAALAIDVACIPIVLVAARLAPMFLRVELWPAVDVFPYVAASVLLFILQSPFDAACHYLLRPNFLFFGAVLRVTTIALLGFVLAPHSGAFGAAIAQLGGSLIVLIAVATLAITCCWRSTGEDEIT